MPDDFIWCGKWFVYRQRLPFCVVGGLTTPGKLRGEYAPEARNTPRRYGRVVQFGLSAPRYSTLMHGKGTKPIVAITLLAFKEAGKADEA